MSRLPPDLENLPKPSVVEEIDIEEILNGKIARLRDNFGRAGLPYTVDRTQYDPAIIQLQGSSFDEGRLRQRMNEAARQSLVAFATGSTLDHIVASIGIKRMVGEDDDRLALRFVLYNQDRNSGGTEPRFMFLALSADIRVADVVVYTIGRNPIIHVSILAADNNGIADQALLDKVAGALMDRRVRMINDTILVEPAVRKLIDVAADIWLLPETPMATFEALEGNLRSAWAAEGKLGRDFTNSWLVRTLSAAGVQRVEKALPVDRVVVPFNEVAAISAVSLTFKGRDY
jgi:phage-related baseplate assembly protein